ncbi:MAG: DUF3467 domain-containing protein [Deltaproteobacteria bacterium]|nr:DUF3467 domain-containing protein [Deltaproteobacteria bacterium]
MTIDRDGKEIKPDGSQPRIKWDGSKMRTTYANIFNVALGREEVVLFFGTSQSWDPKQQQSKVKLMDRIIMNPFAAKRLSRLINKVITDYENRYGTLDVEGSKPETSTLH